MKLSRKGANIFWYAMTAIGVLVAVFSALYELTGGGGR